MTCELPVVTDVIKGEKGVHTMAPAFLREALRRSNAIDRRNRATE